jgi:transposase
MPAPPKRCGISSTARSAAGTVHQIVKEYSKLLVGTESRIKDALTASSVIGADETRLRVATENHWVHVARTDRLTHYACAAGRGKEAMDAVGILPAFVGTLVCDADPAYAQYSQARRGLCGAHLLRELIYIKETCSEQQQWVDPLIKLLLESKAAGEKARAAGAREMSAGEQEKFLRRYDRLVKRAAKPEPSATALAAT